jgi:YfiH family protein
MNLNQSIRLCRVAVAPGLSVLVPPVPGVVFTTRHGGRSRPPYASLNLSLSGGDDPELVAANRRDLSRVLGIPPEWAMARQVHGCGVLTDSAGPHSLPVPPGGLQGALAGPPPALAEADAVIVRTPDRPVAVLAADCVPIALAGDGVAGAVHAGWRGLCAGVIEAAVGRAAEHASSNGLTGWIGPCIGPCCFEVGPEVPAQFAERHPGAPDCTRRVQGRLHFDLRAASAWALEADGARVGGSLEVPCTMCDHRFFSHRRDSPAGPTGRQALITWVPGTAHGGAA